MAWGGRYNYGHFLLDCLPALTTAAEAGLTASHRPIAPPMTDWQRTLLSLLLGAEADRVQERSEPLLRIDDVVFASPMDHFLQAPNQPLDRVRERILAAAAPPAAHPARRIYVSRRGETKRTMVNEAELERALEARGFRVVRPEALGAADQVALFREAEVIVAATGAALANVLFCAPEAKVFEIQPTNYTGTWVRSLCCFVGARWHGFFARSPEESTDIYIEGALKPDVVFRWRTPLDAFLSFLDERL
jgi:capsular polysaccharide biosynthesis protein